MEKIKKIFTKKILSISSEDLEEDVPKVFSEQKLLSDFSGYEKAHLYKITEFSHLKDKEVIIRDGDDAGEVFIIKSGCCEVFKSEDDVEVLLSTLKEGECFGEMALLDQTKRSASVRAAGDAEVLSIKLEDLDKFHTEHPQAYAKLIKNIGCMVSARLKYTNETTLTALKQALLEEKLRVIMGIIIAYLIAILSCYSLISGLSFHLIKNVAYSTLISVPLLIFAAVTIFIMIYQTGEPLERYGLTLKNYKRDVIQSLVWTFFFLFGLIALKYFFILFIPGFEHLSIFDVRLKDNPDDSYVGAIAIIILYLIFVPIQELVARGALQSCLIRFLPETKMKLHLTVFITAIVFSALHSHLSPLYILLTIVPGVFWGYLYARQKSLVGVVVSHCIVGLFALHVLGLHAVMSGA